MKSPCLWIFDEESTVVMIFPSTFKNTCVPRVFTSYYRSVSPIDRAPGPLCIPFNLSSSSCTFVFLYYFPWDTIRGGKKASGCSNWHLLPRTPSTTHKHVNKKKLKTPDRIQPSSGTDDEIEGQRDEWFSSVTHPYFWSSVTRTKSQAVNPQPSPSHHSAS